MKLGGFGVTSSRHGFSRGSYALPCGFARAPTSGRKPAGARFDLSQPRLEEAEVDPFDALFRLQRALDTRLASVGTSSSSAVRPSRWMVTVPCPSPRSAGCVSKRHPRSVSQLLNVAYSIGPLPQAFDAVPSAAQNLGPCHSARQYADLIHARERGVNGADTCLGLGVVPPCCPLLPAPNPTDLYQR